MKAVTIDRLDLKDHVRWAQHQEVYDSSFVTESNIVALHPEITSTSSIYSSKVEELFELQMRSQSWATFSPPKNFHLFGRRLFSYQLFPTIYWKEEDGEKEESREELNSEDREETSDLLRLVTMLQNFTSHSSTLFEKDKSSLITLLKSIQWINRLLAQINARKLQYQKG